MVQGKFYFFIGSVKTVMMFAPCGNWGRPHHLQCLILLCYNFDVLDRHDAIILYVFCEFILFSNR